MYKTKRIEFADFCESLTNDELIELCKNLIAENEELIAENENLDVIATYFLRQLVS